MKFQLFETGSMVINPHRGRLGVVVDKNPATPWIDIMWFDTGEVECEPKSILQILEQPSE